MASVDKENMINKIIGSSSPYVPAQKVNTPKRATPKPKDTKDKSKRSALKEIGTVARRESDDSSRQHLQQQIETLKQALAKETQARQEAEETIKQMKVAEAAAEREVFILRSKLSVQAQSYVSDEPDCEVSTTASYKDLELGFQVSPLAELEIPAAILVDGGSKPETDMLPRVSIPEATYKNLPLGFSVNDLPIDF